MYAPALPVIARPLNVATPFTSVVAVAVPASVGRPVSCEPGLVPIEAVTVTPATGLPALMTVTAGCVAIAVPLVAVVDGCVEIMIPLAGNVTTISPDPVEVYIV